MSPYSQTDRWMKLSTPLGEDALLLARMEGHEEISRLFRFRLDLLADVERTIAFEDLLGKPVSIAISTPESPTRHVHGIVRELSRTGRDESFTRFTAEVVPRFWRLTKRVRSRIFQRMSVPEILEKVLAGLAFDISGLHGQYPAHNYCVQYRESDFAFASRLMEEEGLYYFFEHSADGHVMVVRDFSYDCAPLREAATVAFDDGVGAGGTRPNGRITEWIKTQQLTAGQSTQGDFCFAMPASPIEAVSSVTEEVRVGEVEHLLDLPGAEELDLCDFPGDYAHRFDGIDAGGKEQSDAYEELEPEVRHAAKLRIEREAADAVTIRGVGRRGDFTPGHKFTLAEHFDGAGDYLITRVEHLLTDETYRSDSGGGDSRAAYENRFECMPVDVNVPYRPALTTPQPVVGGTQTATVVGMPDEEIWTDKYGRVKVRFHWDREDVADADRSAWVRVCQPWAGENWGMIVIPRVGQEVVVDFLEGNPDCPIIVGSVYNDKRMPPFELPAHRTRTAIKTDNKRSDDPSDFSGLTFEDDDGSEEMQLQSQRNMVVNVKQDHAMNVARQNVQHTGAVRFTSVGSFPIPNLFSGSGSGAGDEVLNEAQWAWAFAKSRFGQDYATKIGVDAIKGIGVAANSVFGHFSVTAVDPIALTTDFLPIIPSSLAAIIAGPLSLIVPSGHGEQFIGKTISKRYGAHLRVQRGPCYEFFSSTETTKFPAKLLVAAPPALTLVVALAESLITQFTGKNEDVLAAMNLGLLGVNTIIKKKIKTLEHAQVALIAGALNLQSGMAMDVLRLLQTPVSGRTGSTAKLLKDLIEKYVKGAVDDAKFMQGEPTGGRAAKQALVDGPYSVKASGGIELATYDGLASGDARLNLEGKNALLSAKELCSLHSGGSVVQVQPDDISVYGGLSGTVKLGAGFSVPRVDASCSAKLEADALTLAVGQSPMPAKVEIKEDGITLSLGAPGVGPAVALSSSSIELKVGTSMISIDASEVRIKGPIVSLEGQGGVMVQGPIVNIK